MLIKYFIVPQFYLIINCLPLTPFFILLKNPIVI